MKRWRSWTLLLALLCAFAAPPLAGCSPADKSTKRKRVTRSKRPHKKRVTKPRHAKHPHGHGRHPHKGSAHHHHSHPHPHLSGPGHHHPY